MEVNLKETETKQSQAAKFAGDLEAQLKEVNVELEYEAKEKLFYISKLRSAEGEKEGIVDRLEAEVNKVVGLESKLSQANKQLEESKKKHDNERQQVSNLEDKNRKQALKIDQLEHQVVEVVKLNDKTNKSKQKI